MRASAHSTCSELRRNEQRAPNCAPYFENTCSYSAARVSHWLLLSDYVYRTGTVAGRGGNILRLGLPRKSNRPLHGSFDSLTFPGREAERS